MIIFLRELKRNLKYFIIWTSLMTLFICYMGFLFPTMSSQSENMKKMLEQMPKALSKAFNMDLMDFSNVVNYFASEPYVFLLLFGSIFSMILAAGILSKEESDKTIEFLYAKPVTRNNIVTSKLLGTLSYICAFNVILGGIAVGIFMYVSNSSFDLKSMIMLMIGSMLAQLVFAAIGFFISVFVVKAKAILPLSIGVVIGAYFLNSLAGMSDKTDKFKYFTPFKYVDARDILENKSINAGYLIIMLAVIAISIVLSYVFYNRKNITV